MKILEHVMNNRYEGDGTVHPSEHLLFLHELFKLFKCAGITMENVNRNYSHYHCLEELHICINY